jgi:hypothetical protein
MPKAPQPITTFTKSLESEPYEISAALESDDPDRIKVMSDRLKLIQSVDPAVLKLSTWSFDRAPVIKYAIMPAVSLASSALKEFWQ